MFSSLNVLTTPTYHDTNLLFLCWLCCEFLLLLTKIESKYYRDLVWSDKDSSLHF